MGQSEDIGNERDQDACQIVTAVEYLEQQEALEREAAEALPDDFSVCSFSKGYVLQKVYSCKTCAQDAGRSVGVCYGCFVSCHTTHEVVELFQRRNFRCDCGTKGLDTIACTLNDLTLPTAKSLQINDGNAYNRNFEGIFCICLEAYDPEVETRTMFKCVICEDWFHDQCIGEVPDEDTFEEFICTACVNKHCVLKRYIHNSSMFVLPKLEKVDVETAEVNVNVNRVLRDTATASDTVGIENETPQQEVTKDACLDKIECSLPKESLDAVYTHLFALSNWHERMCRCLSCNTTYKLENLDFLFQSSEEFTPKKDDDAGRSLMDAGMEQLDRMDRVKALNGVHLYNKFKDNLMAYLRDIGERGQVVTKEDVDTFFATQQEKNIKKRART
ncbi:hypothetical protein BASA60_006247 [Batrachochytrium salamandrivorans]|nr:hypothetical protein BASA60_006247 [Batrachochytrium salamandrivorans]